ncbi:MAG: hypothetical protein JSU63_01250 [Phycisphaerales bacterium]|nr:MAG: hypothetical protein JSU63_01250 [Phycisphaerales bacterium]
MTTGKSTAMGSFVKTALIGLAIGTAVAGIGYFPLVRLANSPDVVAMLVGCGISWISGCVGAVPVSRALVRSPQDVPTAILAATALRFVTALALLVPAALSGWFNSGVLVAFLAISYLLMLLVETLLAVRTMKRVFEID